MRPRRATRAFTLFEVMVAIALILALFAAVFGFMFNMFDARKRVADHAARHRAAAALIEHLESALMTCIAHDPAAGAGVRGEATSIRILSRGVATHLAERGRRDAGAFGDLQVTEFRFDETERRPLARRESAVGVSNDRSASVIAPEHSIDEEETAAERAFEPLGGDIARVRLRYHDGLRWRDSFDSLEAGRLPAAIEVAVWFHPWPGEYDRAERESAQPTERLTFRPDAGFDERAFAETSDLDALNEPKPDRLRVIIIPDAAPEDESAPATTDDVLSAGDRS